MKAFEYINPPDIATATAALKEAADRGHLLAGGMDLLGEMKDYIRTPDVVVNLKSVRGLDRVETDAGGLSIGALVTLTTVAEHPAVRENWRALSEAAALVGSPQIRNVGTLGGNLCQRPRCWYYRDEEVICLKKGGDRCYAREGENQMHAILGGGPVYIVHPSDCAPALVALGAAVDIAGRPDGAAFPLERFFILPTVNVLKENVLEPGQVVTHIRVPAPPRGARSHYVKVRHKESFDWALSGTAVMLAMDGETVREARIVLSGVAPIPWRSPEAEAVVTGKRLTAALADEAGAAAVAKAQPLSKNGYKVPLTRNTVRRALLECAGVNG